MSNIEFTSSIIFYRFHQISEEICNGGCHDDYDTSKKQVGD